MKKPWPILIPILLVVAISLTLVYRLSPTNPIACRATLGIPQQAECFYIPWLNQSCPYVRCDRTWISQIFAPPNNVKPRPASLSPNPTPTNSVPIYELVNCAQTGVCQFTLHNYSISLKSKLPINSLIVRPKYNIVESNTNLYKEISFQLYLLPQGDESPQPITPGTSPAQGYINYQTQVLKNILSSDPAMSARMFNYTVYPVIIVANHAQSPPSLFAIWPVDAGGYTWAASISKILPSNITQLSQLKPSDLKPFTDLNIIISSSDVASP